jgi:hypothetical protein
MTSSAVSRAVTGLLTLLSGLFLSPEGASARPSQVLEGTPPVLVSLPFATMGEKLTLAPILYRDQRLEAMVAELERLSPTAAVMLLSIRRAGYPLVFGTFKDLAEEMRQEYGTWDPTRKRTVGYMAPIVRPLPGMWAPLTTVKMLVAINLNRLEELFGEARVEVPEGSVSWDEIQRLETLAVLAHEIVHAYGLAVSGGDPHLGCPDPREGENPEIACVVVGENLVRKEIGAPLDWGYGLASTRTLASRYEDVEARRARLRAIAAHPLLPPGTVPDLAGGR